MDTYFTIKNKAEGLYKEKGSRFIAFAYPIKTVDEVKTIVQNLHKEYHDARHICYAYALGADGAIFRANDDGEPSGTGGKPIHGVLLSNNLTFVLIAVVRYFGGIKLGTSGLIAAYKQAAADAIFQAEIIEQYIKEVYSISFEYVYMNEVMRVLKSIDAQIIQQSFELDCVIHFAIRQKYAAEMEKMILKIDTVKLSKIVEN